MVASQINKMENPALNMGASREQLGSQRRLAKAIVYLMWTLVVVAIGAGAGLTVVESFGGGAQTVFYLLFSALALILASVRPYAGLMLAIPLVFNLFGLMATGWESGVLLEVKPRDVVLIVLLLSSLRYLRPAEFAKLIRDRLALPIVALTLYVLLRVLWAQFEGFDVAQSARQARAFADILYFFPVAILISNRRRLQWFVRALLTCGTIVAIINIAFQLNPGFVMGVLPDVSVAIDYGASQYAPLVSKIFIPGQGLMILAFFIAVFRFILTPSKKIVILIGLLGAGLLSTPSRGAYLAMAAALTVGLTYVARRPSRGWLRRTMVLAAVAVVLVAIAWVASPGALNSGLDYLGSAVTDLQNGTGSFGLRLFADAPRWDLVRQSPLFGFGFVHDSQSVRMFGFRLLTSDTGVDLLIQGGILLAALLAWNYLAFWFHLRQVDRQRMPDAWPTLLAFGTFYLYSIFTTPSSAMLVLDDGLLATGIGMGLLCVVLNASADATASQVAGTLAGPTSSELLHQRLVQRARRLGQRNIREPLSGR